MHEISDDLLEPDNRPTQADPKSLFRRLTAIVESFLLCFKVVHVHKQLSAGDDASDTLSQNMPFLTPQLRCLSFIAARLSASRRRAALLKGSQSQLPGNGD